MSDDDDDDAPDSSPRARRLGTVAAAGWTMGLMMLVLLLVSVTQALRPGAATDLVSLGVAQLLAYSVVVFAMLRVHEPEGSLREFIGVRRVDPWMVALGAALGGGMCPFSEVFGAWVTHRFPRSPEEIEFFARIMDVSTMPRKAGLIAIVVLVIPACEEVFFRGAIFGGLVKATSASGAALTTFALDVIAHPNPRMWPVLAVLSATLGWLRFASGGIAAPLAAQVVHSAIPVALAFLGKDDISGRALVAGGIAYGVGLVSTIVVFRSRRA